MSRSTLLALALVAVPAAAPAFADDPKPVPVVPAEAPKVVSNDEAKAAIAKFKEQFKGKDVALKADVIDSLAKVQHPDVIAELARLLGQKNAELRAVAAQDLGGQKALPALAGSRLAASIEPNWTDWSHLADVVDSMKALGWRGSLPFLLKMLKHPNQAVARWAIDAIGDMKDVRALDPILDLMKELKIEEGASWDGVEVHVDTGTAGDADQKAAEAQGQAALAARAAKGKSAGRKSRSIGEIVYLVLKDLTGEQLVSAKAVRAWAEKHKPELDAKKKALDDEQKKQDAESQAAVAAAKAGK